MRLVRTCVEKAEAESMLAWLYDEDRWPFGFAGGLVTQDKCYQAKHLLFTRRSYDGQPEPPVLTSAARMARTGNGTLLARYHVVLRYGRLENYRLLRQDEQGAQATGQVWYSYLETQLENPSFNNQTYVDTLNREAIERFVHVTH